MQRVDNKKIPVPVHRTTSGLVAGKVTIHRDGDYQVTRGATLFRLELPGDAVCARQLALPIKKSSREKQGPRQSHSNENGKVYFPISCAQITVASPKPSTELLMASINNCSRFGSAVHSQPAPLPFSHHW